MTRVLLIEDDDAHAAAAVISLQRHYDVERVADVPAALVLLAVERADVVVLDVGGTGSGDGPEGVRSIKAMDRHVEVVVWSGWSLSELLPCYDEGASQIVLKPAGAMQLIATIEGTLRTWNEQAVDETFFELAETSPALHAVG